jgi:MarR family transcriptional regulator, organic hydroperoxide resistance regulator
MRREETVDYHIKATWHAISRMYNQQASKYGATMSTGFVLLNINSEEGTPATKIAPLMGLEARSLTRILKSMEASGLIYRETDASDRRLVRIFLSGEGRKKKEKAREAVLLFNESVRNQVSAQKLKVFFEVLMEINKVIEKTDSSEPDDAITT